MKIAITGASGFLGRRLVRRLFADGHEICALGRKRPEELPAGVQFSTWDALWGPPQVDADAVVHLAGEPVAQRWTEEARRRIRDSRVIGTNHLVDGIAKASVKPAILVSASAIGYYGDRGDELLTEHSSPGDGFLPETCVAWEGAANRAREFGLPVVTFRISMLLGLEGGALRKMLPAFRMGAGGKLGSGQQWVSWIHIDDMVEAVIFALARRMDGPVNASAPNPLRNIEFTRALAREVRRPAVVPVPGFALRMLFGEMGGMLLESQRVVPEQLERAGFQFRYPRLDAALADVVGGSGPL